MTDETDFQLSSYFYSLPENLVVAWPNPERASDRLLIHKSDGNQPTLVDGVFPDLLDHLPDGALLVANNTRVTSSRLNGSRPGGGKLECLLLTPLPIILRNGEQTAAGWNSAPIDCLLKPAAKIRPGMKLTFGPGLWLEPVQRGDFGRFSARLFWQGDLREILEATGSLPLPPYVRRKPEELDETRYQTIYASVPGAMAAPTAGLHFTPELLDSLRQRGFEWVELTLHTGYGTFSPVRCSDIRNHRMHAEYVELNAAAARRINLAVQEGRPIVAIGTTSLRSLEGVHQKLGRIDEFAGWIDIFLYPGKKFHVVRGLVTNFHLPESTLLMLVCAFAGRKNILAAYRHAISRGYRFFSYGDAMLILPETH